MLNDSLFGGVFWIAEQLVGRGHSLFETLQIGSAPFPANSIDFDTGKTGENTPVILVFLNKLKYFIFKVLNLTN